MATVTGLTAQRMLEIEAMSIVNGGIDLVTGRLKLERHDGRIIDAGDVRGVGLAPGGDTGAAFFKKSPNDFDAEWREIDASDVATGVFSSSRMAHIRGDSSTRAWFTTDPTGGWGGEHTTLAMSPPTDASWTSALELRVSNIPKYAISKDGVLTVGTVPAERVDKAIATTDYVYLTGRGTNSLNNNTALLINAGNGNISGHYNNAYIWRWDHTGTLVQGTVPRARLETAYLGDSQNLNNYTTTGTWHQGGNAQASTGSNYPVPLAGLLEVEQAGGFVYQRYTTYAYSTSGDDPRNARVYTRGRYNGTWSTWQSISKQGHAAGRVGIQVTTANTIASAYVSFPTGRFNAGAPAVTATCHSGAANGRMVTISDPSTSGVVIYLWAHAVVSNSVSWIAQEWG